MKLFLTLITLLFLFSVASATLAQSTNVEDYYLKGKQLIESSKYAEAIELLEQIYAEKKNDSTFLYNLAIAYYKNKNYDKAEAAFLQLTNSKKLLSQSYFNLGLIRIKQDKLEEAKVFFALAIENDSSNTITPLANKMIDRIDSEDSTPKFMGQCFCFLFMDFGYEDKTLSYDDNLSSSNESSPYINTMIFARTSLLPYYVNSLGTNITLMQSTNVNNSEFNFYFISGDLDKSFVYDSWRLTLLLTPTYMGIAGDPYLASIEAGIKLKKRFDEERDFTFQVKSSYVKDFEKEYSPNEGSQQKFRIQYAFPILSIPYRIYFEHERNDRQNKSTQNAYYDYSPQRNKIDLSANVKLKDKLSLKPQLSYRNSRYSSANKTAIDSKLRVDDQLSTSIQFKFAYSKKLDVNLTYDFQQNESTIDDYSIRRNRLSIGLDYQI